MTDDLTKLARAVTEAEDNLNESNHRDECEELARMDRDRAEIAERIANRETALNTARDALLAYVNSEGAVKVEIENTEAAEAAVQSLIETFKDPSPANGQVMRDHFAPFQTAVSNYANGLDGHNEE